MTPHPIGPHVREPSTPPPGHSGVSDCQPAGVELDPPAEIRTAQQIRAALLAAWPDLGDDPVYLDQLAEVAAAAVDQRVIAELTRDLEDERGSHAMTQAHFTDYSEEWATEIAGQRREIARLTELLAGAQLGRDQAQARVAAARQLAEEWRRPGYWAGSAPAFADQLDTALDHGKLS